MGEGAELFQYRAVPLLWRIQSGVELQFIKCSEKFLGELLKLLVVHFSCQFLGDLAPLSTRLSLGNQFQAG